MTKKTIMIACEVVAKEMERCLPKDLPLHLLDPALHVHPNRLRRAIQDVIDKVACRYDTVLLGYGLCSRAVEGLRAEHARMIMPRVDDCIGLFLESKANHLKLIKKDPGTFFLSKGWIDVGSTPFEEYAYMVKRFGTKRADCLMNQLLYHYKWLAFIDTGSRNNDSRCRSYAKDMAEWFGLEYKEITGGTSLFDKLIKAETNNGDCGDLLVVPPGKEISYDMFMDGAKSVSCSATRTGVTTPHCLAAV